MTLATAVWYGRYWYDFLVIIWVVAFFLVEMALLYRNSLIGWAMTMKCLTLAGVFSWALFNPPMIMSESVTIEKVAIYSVLILVLGFVITVLLWMRLRHIHVVVGKEDTCPCP